MKTSQARDNSDMDARINEAEVCRSMGLYDESLEIYEQILSSIPSSSTEALETIKGRSYGVTILTRYHIIILQCNAKEFEQYKPDFDYMLSTFRITSDTHLYHEVVKGETLYRISIKYGISVDELKRLNNLKNNQPIYPKQKLIVAPVSTH